MKKEKETPKETIEQMIRRIAVEEKIDPNLAYWVAYCESGLNPKAKNVNRNGTTDRGLFQINDYWHPYVTDEQAYDPEFSIKFFCNAVKQNKLWWWNASRPCWDKKYKYSQ